MHSLETLLRSRSRGLAPRVQSKDVDVGPAEYLLDVALVARRLRPKHKRPAQRRSCDALLDKVNLLSACTPHFWPQDKVQLESLAPALLVLVNL